MARLRRRARSLLPLDIISFEIKRDNSVKIAIKARETADIVVMVVVVVVVTVVINVLSF
jgi:hypothetical protein